MKNGKTKFCLWYEKTIGRIIPKYGFLSVIFCFIFNSLIYTGLQILMKDVKRFDLTTSYDEAIPFQPEWVFIYLVCFLFWGVNYILMTRQGKEGWYQFAAGDYLSRILCGMFFILIPTTNIRPEVVGDGLAQVLMRFVYQVDAASNLFPSIHCLVSWLCFAGIRGKSYVPKWYQAFSCVFALAVFASTLFTKQHFIIDAIAGMVFAELCYYIGRHGNYYQWIEKQFDKINEKLFGENWYEG